MSDGFAIERDARTVTLRLDRPPLNVLGAALMTALAKEARALAKKPDHRALVIAAKGKAFSAGADVAEHLGAAKTKKMLGAFRDLIVALDEHPRPTIALVRGACLGGGLELALACDLVWASSAATLGSPEIKLGVFAPFAAAMLPRRTGLGAALELLLTGTAIPAEEARAIGLVDRILDDAKWDDELASALGVITAHPGRALGLTKRAARAGSLAKELDRVVKLYVDECLPDPDATEGLKAFLEKRAPVWRAS